MNKRLVLYKQFIDDLVELRADVSARWVRDKGWPNVSENKPINKFLKQLTPEQKQIVAQMLQQARDSGIHDVLAYLNDEVNLAGLRLVKHGTELAVEPYGTEMYYDWVCRREGDDWPEHQLDNEYRADS